MGSQGVTQINWSGNYRNMNPTVFDSGGFWKWITANGGPTLLRMVTHYVRCEFKIVSKRVLA